MTKVLDTVGEYKQIQTPDGPKWINGDGDSCSDPRAVIRPATRGANRMAPVAVVEAPTEAPTDNEPAEVVEVAKEPETAETAAPETDVRRKNDNPKRRDFSRRNLTG